MKPAARLVTILTIVVGLPPLALPQQTAPAPPRQDAAGNPVRRAPTGHVSNYDEAKATRPVPLVLHLMFGPRPSSEPARPMETGPLADILSRGYGYAHFRYTEVQPDARDSGGSGVIALALAPGQTKPEPDEWGSITA